MHLLEIVGRVVAVYVVCMVLLRLTRREMSEMGPMDLLTMLLLSETVSPAMTANSDSLVVGLVAAGTLMALCVFTEILVFRSRRAAKLIEGSAEVLIRDGKVNSDAMRRFRITDEDLRATLHDKGLLGVDEVKRAFVEADGQITVIESS
jgi:uncharacterized membrane protein YcaP (DUF421 family)